MIYTLDSNTISYMLRKEGHTLSNFTKEIVELGNHYAIPFIVAHEIKRWLFYKPTQMTKDYSKKFNELFNAVKHRAEMPEIVWDKATYLYIDLKSKGALISNSDIIIAAYCIVNDYTLATRNTKDFNRIDDLNLVNWFD